MRIIPVPESQAKGSVHASYRQIKEALSVPNVPIFFQYIGAFPNYLHHITPTVVNNATDVGFNELLERINSTARAATESKFPQPQVLREFLGRNKQTGEVIDLKRKLTEVSVIIAKLLILFMALRESVKSWANMRGQLPGTTGMPQTSDENDRRELHDAVEKELITVNALVPHGNLSVSLMSQFFEMSRMAFNQIQKTQDYLVLRVEMERMVLRTLADLPYPINSSVNLVLVVTKTYPDFPDLLYLLADDFPTIAMQRWLLSMYMLI